VVAAAVGITMFGETFRYGSAGTALALSCGVVAAGGLILLTTERIDRTHAEPEPLPAAELVAPLPEQPVTAVREGALVPAPTPAAIQEVLVPAPSAVPVQEGGVLIPAPAAIPVQESTLVPPAPPVQEDIPEDREPPESDATPAHLYGLIYGGLYVPLPGVVGRHRTRVRS
jgi:hypothetical protein